MPRAELRSAIVALLPRLRRFGISLTGSVAEAEELAQDACKRALADIAQLHTIARLDGWMYEIMTDVWAAQMRSGNVVRHGGDGAVKDGTGNADCRVAEGAGDLASVRRALAALPAEQRSMLILVCVDGMSYAQAADTLGVPLDAAVSRLSRARIALAERLMLGRRLKPVT